MAQALEMKMFRNEISSLPTGHRFPCFGVKTREMWEVVVAKESQSIRIISFILLSLSLYDFYQCVLLFEGSRQYKISLFCD